MEQTVISTFVKYDGENKDDAATAHLRDETQKIIEAMTAPAYVAALRAVKATPIEKRLLEASKRLTPDALRKQGVKLPDNMRISSRYFESGFPRPLDLGDMADGKPNPLSVLISKNPGLLDDLRANNLPAFNALISNDGSTGGGVDDMTAARLGGCTCGGTSIPIPPFTSTACAGAGVHLM
jgi:hypothetical protein